MEGRTSGGKEGLVERRSRGEEEENGGAETRKGIALWLLGG